MNRARGASVLAPAVVFLLLASSAFAQGVGINGTGAAADTSAILDLKSTSKGFLPPRMTQAERLAIVLPANGLVVFQTDGQAGLYYNVGTSLAPSWKLVADAGSLSTGPWTVSGPNIYYTGGKVGIDRTSPAAPLDILGGNWDVVNGEGDIRIGDAATRLKIGLALGGGGTGAATIMEQGPVGAYNTLSLGTQGNKVLHVNGATQRVGIGTDAPTAPLGFPATLGKKITLYPGGANDYGLGIDSGRLQMYTDSPSADIALGYDVAGTFNEKFAFKNNGALAVNGNAGSAGQVLQSNGASSAASWVSPTSVTYNNIYQLTNSVQTTLNANEGPVPLPGLNFAFSLPKYSRVIVSVNMQLNGGDCVLCGRASPVLWVYLDGSPIRRYYTDVSYLGFSSLTPTFMVEIGPGAHIMTVMAQVLNSGPSVTFGSNTGADSMLLVQVIPQ